MRATVLHAPGDIRLETVPDAVVEDDTDAVVRVVAACVCGSDLWPYRGANGAQTEPRRIGHELVGVVECQMPRSMSVGRGSEQATDNPSPCVGSTSRSSILGTWSRSCHGRGRPSLTKRAGARLGDGHAGTGTR